MPPPADLRADAMESGPLGPPRRCPVSGETLPPGWLVSEAALAKMFAGQPFTSITKTEAEANWRALAAGPPVRPICWLPRSFRIRGQAAEFDKLYEPRPAYAKGS